jgi:GTP-binding protein YchF
MLSLGIVGLPNAGKSSLFKALTRLSVPIANYPFTTIEPHHGVVAVPDERLQKLAAVTPGNAVVPTAIEFVDIAGLVEGAHRGEGLGNQFLSHIREVDGIVEVVRLFEDPTVPHPLQTIDPERDIQIIEQELIHADMKLLERQREAYRGAAHAGDKDAIKKFSAIQEVLDALAGGRPARDVPLTDEAHSLLREYNLLTQKPIIFVWNVNESGSKRTPHREGVALPLKLLADFADVPEHELEALKKEFGVEQDMLGALIQKAYEVLGLITFFTVKPPETRAWAVKKGTALSDAGAAIHTDFKEKFIRAEVIPIDELLQCGSWHAAKSSGKLRIEGKEYIVQDGDVIEFKV